MLIPPTGLAVRALVRIRRSLPGGVYGGGKAKVSE